MLTSLPTLLWPCEVHHSPDAAVVCIRHHPRPDYSSDAAVCGKASGAGRALLCVVIRGTPLLVQLFVIFYGLPSVGILLDAFSAALIGFTLNVGAYTSEIIRAAISSVPKGQWEAAYSTGMTWGQAMRRTILPQPAASPCLRCQTLSSRW